MSFRPDIDGLRALAVVLVLAYHCGLPAINYDGAQRAASRCADQATVL
jgi:peptidoglycan/LPS O-acetylase OafA/YrhL